jgi:hypothetical protein
MAPEHLRIDEVLARRDRDGVLGSYLDGRTVRVRTDRAHAPKWNGFALELDWR